MITAKRLTAISRGGKAVGKDLDGPGAGIKI